MKRIITNYLFSAAGKTVTLPDYAAINLPSVLLIVDVATNAVIYNFSDPALGGSVAGNVITLDCDTSALADTDALLIYYDDPAYTPALSSEMQEYLQVSMMLLETLDALRVIAAVRDNSNALRATITNVPTVGVNSVTATLNLSQYSGYSTVPIPWAICNTAVIKSNIANVIVS